MGRPPLGDDAKREVVTVRVTKALRERLSAAAASSGRSMAHEIELRLERMFYDEDMRSLGPAGRTYVEMLASVVGAVQARTGKSLDEDYATWTAVARAVEIVTADFDPDFDPADKDLLDRAGEAIAEAGRDVEPALRELRKVAKLPAELSAEAALVTLLKGAYGVSDDLSAAKLGLEEPDEFDMGRLAGLKPPVQSAATKLVLALRKRSRASAAAIEAPDAAAALARLNFAASAAADVLNRRQRLLPKKRS